jgi:hypothetical protein
LPLAGALIAHQTPFFGSAHLSSGDKVADNTESKHRNLHFFICSHNLPPFWDFSVPYPKKKAIKMTLFTGVYPRGRCLQIKWHG